jgi:hypothetical protein
LMAGLATLIAPVKVTPTTTTPPAAINCCTQTAGGAWRTEKYEVENAFY